MRNYAGSMVVLSRLPLYWQVCVINGGLFLLGTAVLVLSPATVSSRPLISEIVVLAVGLAAMLIANGLLLRSVLAPLDQLRRAMPTVDLLAPGRRLQVRGSGPVADLVASFDAMVDRLETERSASTRLALQAQEGERQRIATELHDELGQSLTVILLSLSRAIDALPPSAAGNVGGLRTELLDIQAMTRGCIDEVRGIATRLRPGLLDDLGLNSALAAMATEFSRSTGLEVRRGFAPGLRPLPPEAELVIYRVAQEALTNAARHAQAEVVELTLSREGAAALLRVADDGIGPARMIAAAGIGGMRERAAMVNGRFDLGPRVGGGTEVRLLVPIATESEARN